MLEHHGNIIETQLSDRFGNILCEVFVYVLICWLIGELFLSPASDKQFHHELCGPEHANASPKTFVYGNSYTNVTHRASRGTVAFFFYNIRQNEKNKINLI